MKKSATIAVARHSSAEHFDPREQVQLLNQSITKQAEAISQIAKKTGEDRADYEKSFKIS